MLYEVITNAPKNSQTCRLQASVIVTDDQLPILSVDEKVENVDLAKLAFAMFEQRNITSYNFV